MDFNQNTFKVNNLNGGAHNQLALVERYQENLNVNNLKDNFNSACKSKGYQHKLPHIISGTKYKRIIVIGDLHGDVKKTLKALLVANVINRKSKWIGGKTAVVQIGDQLDGCRPTGENDDCSEDGTKDYADIRVMDILDKFHKKAVKHGGAIFSLIGNHEVMQEDDNRYISPNSYKYFNNYVDPNTGKTISDGKKARKHAFQPGNEYAVRLACTRQTALIIGDFLFVHAGILPNLAKNLSIKQLNLVIRNYLLGKQGFSGDEEIEGVGTVKDLINNYNISPFWPRFFGQMKHSVSDKNYLCRTKLQPTLDYYEVNGMFVGHTPQFMYGRGINSTCSNKLWRVDVGMSSAFQKFSDKRKSRDRKVQVLQIKNNGKNPKDFSILVEL
jgi:hypothetical protein